MRSFSATATAPLAWTLASEDAVSSPQGDAVADFNGDGFLDIARGMGDGTRGLVQILHGNGDGTFRPVVRYAVPPPMSSVGGGFIITADVNGDTKPSIILEVRGAGPATDVLLNTGGAPLPTGPTVSALSLNPSSVSGGSAATGTVTLSARASTRNRRSIVQQQCGCDSSSKRHGRRECDNGELFHQHEASEFHDLSTK